jgi:hypothetical protein
MCIASSFSSVAGFETADARDGDVLAGLGDGRRHLLRQRRAGGDDAVRIAAGGDGEEGADHIGDERLEVLGAGDEVRLAVDLGEHAAGGVVGEACGHEAFARGPARALGGLGDAALAEDRDGVVEVAVGFAQGGLAFHHARAGLVAQGLYLISGDYGCHASVLSVESHRDSNTEMSRAYKQNAGRDRGRRSTPIRSR